MASSDSTSSPSISSITPLSPSSRKENQLPTQSKIAELNESRSELLSRIQGLKQDLQTWRSKLDTQVKGYRKDLTELRESLHVEVEQLRSEFQDLRTTLQQQQEEVTVSLQNLGLQDPPKDATQVPAQNVDSEGNNEMVESHVEHLNDQNSSEVSAEEGCDAEIPISLAEKGDVENDH